MAQVRDNDAPSHHERDVERISEFFVAPPGLDALDNVVIDTVVAPQHRRRHQPKQFLRIAGQCTVVISHRIEVEEPVDSKVSRAQDALVHSCSVISKLIQTSTWLHIPSSHPGFLANPGRMKCYFSVGIAQPLYYGWQNGCCVARSQRNMLSLMTWARQGGHRDDKL